MEHHRNILLALALKTGHDLFVMMIPWLSVSGKSLISSSSYWLLIVAMALLPPAWDAFSPWDTTPRMANELTGLAILLGSAWGIHHAISLRDVWSRGGTATFFLAPLSLIVLPAAVLHLCAHFAQSPPDLAGGKAFWTAWGLSLPKIALFAVVARCVVSLPGRPDLLTAVWIVLAWMLASHAAESSWLTEFAWNDSRLRHLQDSETAKSYAQQRLLPILGWAMLSWAICTRGLVRAVEVVRTSSADQHSS